MTDASVAEVLAWHPHVDVWIVIAVLAGGYWYANWRIGPMMMGPGQPAVRPRQVTAWYGGLALLWLVSGWPLHDIGQQALFTFHMVEHLVLALGVAPLLLLGTPRWLAELLLSNQRLLAVVRTLSRPVAAFFVFNLILAAIHWPPVVELMLTSSIAHFVIHSSLFGAALIMWMPILSPHPEIPRLRPPLAILYLFAQSIIPTVPASFLTFGREPLYALYAEAPRLWGIDAVTDQAIAGLVMKLGGAAVFWATIAVIWFRWQRQETEWDELERRLREGA